MQNLTSEQLKYCLALYRIPTVGPVRFSKLLENFPDPRELFTLPKNQLLSLNLPEPITTGLQTPNWAGVERDLCWAEQPGHCLLWHEDPRYPPLLKEISSAPPFLFIQGSVDLLSSQQIAIVGSRNPTPMGKETAFHFARSLAEVGFTVTSGLALGIDGVSHEGAVADGGKTLAVLGSGVDCIYPKRHRHLAERIVTREGAILSEFPIGTQPQAEHFPQRNRLVSGLSLGVLVVEATIKSGSLITAGLAGEQGREVFAIPGSIRNPLSSGCHLLIQRGAKLVTSLTDILEEFPQIQSDKRVVKTAISPQRSTPGNKKLLAEDYRQLLECIGFEATSIDQMVERSGRPPHIIAAMALTLELDGHIYALAGGDYSRTG